VEVQMVFKGQMPQGHQQWDNNDGNNWQVWGCGCGVQLATSVTVEEAAHMHGCVVGMARACLAELPVLNHCHCWVWQLAVGTFP
jgi:hypothetical protein